MKMRGKPVSNNLKVLLNSLDEKELRKLIGKEKLEKMQGKPKVKVVEKEPDLEEMKADMQDFINKSIKAGFKDPEIKAAMTLGE